MSDLALPDHAVPNQLALPERYPDDDHAVAEGETARREAAVAGASEGTPPGLVRPIFDLFIARSGHRRKADLHVRRVLEALLPAAGFELTVIDVHEQPDRARQARILATPTLIRRRPGPEVRVVGDLTNREAILRRFALR